MIFEVFRKFVVLFFCCLTVAFGQSTDNEVTVELGATIFPIERPFTISVVVAGSESRPVTIFPDLPGLVRKGTSASVRMNDAAGKSIASQVITQNYQALAAGRFRVPPFTVTVNGKLVRSEGAVLIVQPSATAPVSTSPVAAIAPPPPGAAFLQLQTSKPVIYAGEGIVLTLSFFVIDNYPYELNFTALDKQLQAITKKIRPANAWEENTNITELKPIPVSIRGKRFREYRLYQAVFFPLASRPLQLPAVTLRLERPRPVIGPPSSEAETVEFTSRPVTVAVRALPNHPLRGQVPVGSFRVEEDLERQRVGVGQSVRYTFGVVGEGNIATLPAPVILTQNADADIFPPQERQLISQSGGRVTGRKSFTYFIVPHKNGPLALANQFRWVYFDPKTGRYDTLQPNQTMQVGGNGTATVTNTADSAALLQNRAGSTPGDGSIYTGIETVSSSEQSINGANVIRFLANILVISMLVGMVFVFFKR